MHNKMHNNILFLKYIFLFILSKFKKSEKYKKKNIKKLHWEYA